MNRRGFLKKSGLSAAGMGMAPLLQMLASSSAFADPANDYKAIVCLLLDGGADGNNMLVPADSHYAEYAAGRGPLALGRSSLQALVPASSGRLFGAHSALSNVSALYNSGHAAWLANAGPLTSPITKQALMAGAPTPLSLYDHVRQKDEWQSANTKKVIANGWAGRIADVMNSQASASSVPMVISTAGWTLLGAGVNTTAAAVGSGANPFAVMNALQALMPTIVNMEGADATNHLHDAMASIQSGILHMNGQLNAAFSAGAGLATSFPSSSLGQQLQIVAQLIKGRSTLGASRQIFICTDNGYDTHTSQLSVQNNSLAGIDAGVSSFVSAMNELGMFEQVTLFTMTDFARAQQSNGSAGSDHAWGNHHLIVGGAVKGGDVYGTFPSLILGGDDDAGTTGVWIPTTSGSQYAATLASWLGVSATDNAAIFPELENFSKPLLGFL